MRACGSAFLCVIVFVYVLYVLSVLFYACIDLPMICMYACDSYVFVAIDMIGATVRSRKPRKSDRILEAFNTPWRIRGVPVEYP